MNILIVEDEAAIANVICQSLTWEGYRCTCAHHGHHAADLIEKDQKVPDKRRCLSQPSPTNSKHP